MVAKGVIATGERRKFIRSFSETERQLLRTGLDRLDEIDMSPATRGAGTDVLRLGLDEGDREVVRVLDVVTFPVRPDGMCLPIGVGEKLTSDGFGLGSATGADLPGCLDSVGDGFPGDVTRPGEVDGLDEGERWGSGFLHRRGALGSRSGFLRVDAGDEIRESERGVHRLLQFLQVRGRW